MPPNRVAFFVVTLSGRTKNPMGSREEKTMFSTTLSGCREFPRKGLILFAHFFILAYNNSILLRKGDWYAF